MCIGFKICVSYEGVLLARLHFHIVIQLRITSVSVDPRTTVDVSVLCAWK